MRLDAGEMVLRQDAVRVRLQVQHRVGPHFLQDREIGLVFGQQVTQGAFRDGGIGLDVRAVRPEDDVTAALQVDGGDLQGQPAHLYLQVAVRPLREGRCGVQMDRDAHPARRAGGEESLGIGGKDHVAVLAFRFQVVKRQGDRVLGQTPIDEQAVGDDFAPGIGQMVGVHLAVRPQMFHPQHRQQRVLLVGVYDKRPAGQVNLVQANGRSLAGGGIVATTQAEDLPVCGRTIIIMGENAGMVQFRPTDVIAGLFQDIDQVEGRLERPERSQRVHHRRPPRLQERETAFLHDGGVVPGVPVVRIHEREIVQREVQEGEILDD